jgi:hypothetical protein
MRFGFVRREYRFKILRCALRQGFVIALSMSSPPQTSSAVSAFPNGERIALGCGRAEMLIITLGSRHAKAQS